MKISEIRELSTEELESKVRELKHEHFNLRVQNRIGQLEQPSLLRDARREAARIKTVLSERKNAAAEEKAASK